MSKYIKIDWGDSSKQAPTKETFLAYIASLQKQINDNKITVDSQLSDTSENAVQNKVVKAEIDKKQDDLKLITEISTDFITIMPSSTSSKQTSLLHFSGIQGDVIGGTNGSFENSIETPIITHSHSDNNGYTQININETNISFVKVTLDDNGAKENTVTLSGVTKPTHDTDAANKSYVDTEVIKNKIVITTF